MVFRNFRLQIILRVLLLVASLIFFVHFTRSTSFVVSASIIFVAVVIQIISLFRYIDHTNRRIRQLLDSIRHSDFSTGFSDSALGRSFDELSRAFNEVITEFNKTRALREEHFNYLQTVVQHSSIGLISYRKDGKIDIYNNAVKRMFRIQRLMHIDDLGDIHPELPGILATISAGDDNLLRIFIEDELMQVSIRATEFRMRGEEFVLVSLQNIHNELEQNEVESWQKLIRILTHEMMNSITPITSLAGSVKGMLVDEKGALVHELDEESLESVNLAFRTIEERSRGLLHFVDAYRSLTRIPKPNFRYIRVEELFSRLGQLMDPKIRESGIAYHLDIRPPDLMITADPDLLDQVLINMVMNSIDALKDRDDPTIRIEAEGSQQGRVFIRISDNGSGIPLDIIENIFLPFFTSKKDGNGIGLSLSRQIMHLHKGKIRVNSQPGEGATFTLVF